MKKISFVQVNFQQGPKDLNSFYLPYSVGCLWAYANSFKSIQEKYQLGEVLWRRDLLDDQVKILQDSDIIGFSTYVWNRNHNYELAKRVKQVNPRCFIVFGGPEPPITDPDIFVKHPYIDAVIVHEGEVTFKNLLDNIDDPQSVTGMVVNHHGKSINTGKPDRINDVETLPSPYLTGFFDKIVADNPQVLEWAGTLETNRGCPYACTFCDWGSLTYNKVKKLDLERVFAEIEWMGKNRVGWMSITDANFGMFVERDNLILDKFLEVQERTGYPILFAANYAKNQKVEVLDIVTKIIKKSKKHVAGHKVSIQSLTEPVLDIIKRKNLRVDDCAKIFALAEERGIPIGTEMIMGLPGENKRSWRESIWKLFKMGLHSNIDIYICQVLENTELNLVQKQIYDIKTAKIVDYMNSPHEQYKEIKEDIEVIVSHSDMPFEDTVDTAIFNWFITTFHFYGFTNFVSRYLYKSQGIEYEDFYRGLHQHMKQDEYFLQQRQSFKDIVMQWFNQGSIDDHYRVQSFHISGQTMFSFTVLDLHTKEHKIHEWFELIRQYIVKNYPIQEPVFEDLMRLQTNAPVLYSKLDQYPNTVNFNTNIYEYIISRDDNLQLQYSNTKVMFEFPEPGIDSLNRFVEALYYRRLRHFGTTWIKNES
jgi:radical SAM superfamily enzyme YgiQ (UPF0313 family)